MPTKPEGERRSKWIEVAACLPDAMQDILIAVPLYSGKAFEKYHYEVAWFDNSGEGEPVFSTEDTYYEIGCVEYWRRLPEAPPNPARRTR
jgi:hypothetical protein